MNRSIGAFSLSFLVVLVIYVMTSAPGLGLVDSGELTTVACTLGIAHPTGYPLYTLAGHVWLMLLPGSPARAMVLFSVFMGACASGILSVIVLRLFEQVTDFGGKTRIAALLAPLIAAVVSVSFALSPTAWTAISFAEVYPLTWLLTALILLSSLMYFTQHDAARAAHLPLVICYLWGLGFGNHLTILWFVPLVAYVVWKYGSQSVQPLQALVFCALLFLLGTSINLYLPIRSALGPALNWSDPETLPGLIRHLTAWQYRVWMFKGSVGAFVGKLGSYLATVPGDFGWFFSVLALIGLVVALVRRNGLILAFAAVWLVGIAYNLNYDIPDISTYFLVFYGALLCVAAFGMSVLMHQIWSWRMSTATRSAAVAGLAALGLASSIFASGTSGLQSYNHFAQNFSTELTRTLPDSALVLQANWDIQSPLIYRQLVERARPDLVMLDLNLMQRPWYIKQEQRAHPEVFAASSREISSFLRVVHPFEQGEPYNGGEIEDAYVSLMNSIIAHALPIRPVYVRDAREIGHPGVAGKLRQIPGAYFTRISDSTLVEPVINPASIVSGLSTPDDRELGLLKGIAMSTAVRTNYAMKMGDRASVRAASAALHQLEPFTPEASQFLLGVDRSLQISDSLK